MGGVGHDVMDNVRDLHKDTWVSVKNVSERLKRMCASRNTTLSLCLGMGKGCLSVQL